MEIKKIQHTLLGALFPVLIGCTAFYIAGFHKVLDPLVVGIVLGMLVRFFIGKRDFLDEGFTSVAKVVIPIGIIIYGVNLKFHKLNIIPVVVWLQIIIGVIIIFGVNYFLCSKLSVSSKTGLLMATGTAICGASAIAFATPVVKADSEDTSVSLLVITIWGLVGMLLYPLLQKYIDMNTDNYALLCATTLHQTGLVKTAAAQKGYDCLQTAMIIKMGRTCMIIVLVYALSWLGGRQESTGVKAKSHSRWFLFGFILVGLAFSFLPELRSCVKSVKPFAAIMWTIAMAALGLTVNLRSTSKKIIKPLLLGLLLWLAVVTNFFIGYYGMGY